MSLKKLNVLVTGGNRGIGLEFCNQLAAHSEIGKVFATSRDPNYHEIVDLQKKYGNEKIVIVELDATNESSISDAAKKVDSVLGDQGLDFLINNAGIAEPHTDITKVEASQLTKVFETNVVGPHLITKAFLPALKRSDTRKVMGISSKLGSMSLNLPSAFPSYNISKTSLNMLFKQYANSLKAEKFTFVVTSPGYVKTRLAPQGMLTTTESVNGLLKVLFSITTNDNGSFINYDGEKIPW